METLVIILICLIAISLPASPFIMKREEWVLKKANKKLDDMKNDKEIYYQAIKDVDFEFAEGKLSEKDHQELRDYYKEKAIQTVRDLEAIESTASPSEDENGENRGQE